MRGPRITEVILYVPRRRSDVYIYCRFYNRGVKLHPGLNTDSLVQVCAGCAIGLPTTFSGLVETRPWSMFIPGRDCLR